MASNGSLNTTGEPPATVAPPSGSPKGMVCLCSPTTHQGSFRCRFHRAQSSTAWMKRSNSMPVRKGGSSNSSSSSSSVTSLSPKSVESA